MEKVLLSASIVLYKEDLSVLKKTVRSFLSANISKKLFLIDNTPKSIYKNVFNENEIYYIENKKNIGFGSGHNKILPFIKNYSKFHLILNPDVSFDKETIPKLILELQKDEDLAMIAPKVLFPDGKHQYSCRRYPKVSELLARRFIFLKPFFKKTINKGQYIDKNLQKPFYAEYLTGCFHLYKTQDLVNIKGFDERYFLYLEDVDICRKVDEIGKKKLYFPDVKITHILKQGSLRNANLFFQHTSSAIKYFLKWGF